MKIPEKEIRDHKESRTTKGKMMSALCSNLNDVLIAQHLDEEEIQQNEQSNMAQAEPRTSISFGTGSSVSSP